MTLSAGPVALRRQGAPNVALHQLRAGIPTRGVADAAEASRTGGHHRFQHRADGVAQLQVGVADDGGGGFRRAVAAGGGLGGDGLDIFHLTHGPHLLRPVLAILAAHLDEHRGADVVPAANVGGQLGQEVSLVRGRFGAGNPEMVVRVADRQVRLQGLFDGLRQPVFAFRCHVVHLGDVASPDTNTGQFAFGRLRKCSGASAIRHQKGYHPLRFRL